jgi:uncharacterized membrane protein
MTAAILFAFASAAFLGAAVVTSQLGLRTMEPLSGAALSIPAFALLFLLLSPLILAGEPVVWRGLPIFAAIGLFFPASLTLLAFASNRALGPVITSTGLAIAVSGAIIISVTRPRDLGHWRSWALLLPLAAALVRGVVPPIVKLGLEVWPSPLWACLIGYVMSSLVVLAVQRVREGRFIAKAPASGQLWFVVTGIANGLATLTMFAAVRHGPITLVAPIVAVYPLVTVLLSKFMLKHIAITPRIVGGTVLTVAGVALVLAG